MRRLRPALIERTFNNDNHAWKCGRCECKHGDEVVVLVPAPADCPLSFCSIDCASEWLDEQPFVEEAEAHADYKCDRARERDSAAT